MTKTIPGSVGPAHQPFRRLGVGRAFGKHPGPAVSFRESQHRRHPPEGAADAVATTGSSTGTSSQRCRDPCSSPGRVLLADQTRRACPASPSGQTDSRHGRGRYRSRTVSVPPASPVGRHRNRSPAVSLGPSAGWRPDRWGLARRIRGSGELPDRPRRQQALRRRPSGTRRVRSAPLRGRRRCDGAVRAVGLTGVDQPVDNDARRQGRSSYQAQRSRLLTQCDIRACSHLRSAGRGGRGPQSALPRFV